MPSTLHRTTPRVLRALFPLLLTSCATYHPSPLDPESVGERLQTPSTESVQIAAGKIEHPPWMSFVFDPSDGLSPDEAAVLAVVANPQLRVARTQRGIAQAELISAGVLPNPQLTGTLDVPVRDTTGAANGTGLGLSLDLNALFTRGADKAAARARKESVELDLAWEEWQIAQQARLQTYRQLLLRQQLMLAREEETALRVNVQRLDEAAGEHLVTEAERAAAADAYRTARATRLELEGQHESARQGLNRVLGEPPGIELGLQAVGVPFLDAADSNGLRSLPAELDTLATVSDDSLVARLQRRRLDLVALRYGYESQEQTLHAAVMRRFPRINIGVNRLVDTSKVLTLGPAVTLDLPFFDRNQGEVQTALATRETLHAEYLARIFTARADVADLRQQITHAFERLVNAEQALPELQHLVDVYGKALQLGNVDALLYYDARTKKIDKELEALRLRQDLAELSVGLRTVMGGYWNLPASDPEER